MTRFLLATIALTAIFLGASPAMGLPADVEKLLADSEYVYIASTRKDGTLGQAAEIWFFYHEGSVYVGTPPSSWRVRRIKWGRNAARIAVGTAKGPAFSAMGELVDDDTIEALLMDAFAKKYPDGWKRHEENFRKGFADGSRVIVKYSPTAGTP